MEKSIIQNTLKKAREASKKRNFKQSIDLIVNLKNIDLKKDKAEFYIDLHNDKGRKVKVCALVGPELIDQAKKVCDFAVVSGDFANYQKDKRLAKKLAKQYDVFIAQGNIMTQVAAAFGRTFGPLNKMPNPKAGCVVLPTANLVPVYEKFQKLVMIRNLKSPIIQVPIGMEGQDEEKVIDNILTVINYLETNLPNKNCLGKTFIKLTMGTPVEVASQ